MSGSSPNGAEHLCSALAACGIDCVFGLPGTQNVALYEALRTSGLRTVVATNELSAAMMANGYFRASGRIAALATIPGPGFTWALTGLAEAKLDSAALLHIVAQPANAPGRHFQLQAIDQAAIATPLVKTVYALDATKDIAQGVREAHVDAVSGEPGPVLLHVSRAALNGRAAHDAVAMRAAPAAIDAQAVASVVELIRGSRRAVIFAGQGAHGAAAGVRRVAEKIGAAVVTSTSGRGVLPEDHALSLGFDLGGTEAGALNALIESSDLVLAIGCKFSHNAARGFHLRIPREKFVHVDAAAHVLDANYPARIALLADAAAFVGELERQLDATAREGFARLELDALRARGRTEAAAEHVEPRFHGVAGGRAEAFFAALRDAMPRESHLLTDSGLHQVMARRHFRVLHPRGFITPTNLQSMGFVIGASIGACIAEPRHAVVAVIGDGGFAMSGLELLTAVREKLKLTVVVLVDGAYGLIRTQQLEMSGHAFGTEFANPDIGAIALAMGARHWRIDGSEEAASVLRNAIAADGVNVVEVSIGDSLPMHWMRMKGAAKASVKPIAKSLLGRLRRRS